MTVWQGFSLRWYQKVFSDYALLEALGVSVHVATLSATLATVLGLLCAMVLARFSKGKTRPLFSFLSTAPLVMPEVMTGLAFLVFFVTLEQSLGWPEGRGKGTMMIAHTTVALAYVTVMIRARLLEMNRSVEEAALDLGARPYRVFFFVTLPTILPALFSGWLLSFALSMDDLVIASFTAGPASTTLPMIMFSSMRLGVTPVINALATLLIFFVLTCVSIGLFSARKGEKQLAIDKIS